MICLRSLGWFQYEKLSKKKKRVKHQQRWTREVAWLSEAKQRSTADKQLPFLFGFCVWMEGRLSCG
jgi:hypothetical protein